MSNYFKIMLNASLAYSKNNIRSENEIIEEFLGFNAAPKVVPNSIPQIPRPTPQPMSQPMPQPMMPTYSPPMYHPIPSMYSMPYPYFGMNNIKQQKTNNKSNDDDDSFLKMLLTAGVLGGGGVAAYKYGPKLFKNSLSDKVGAAIDNSPKALKAARAILGDLGLAQSDLDPQSIPTSSGGLPLSKLQQDRIAAQQSQKQKDNVVDRGFALTSILPGAALQNSAAKLLSFIAGYSPSVQQQLLDRLQTNAALDKTSKDTPSSKSGKSTKPGKSTKSKPTASTGKKKK